MYEKVRAMKMRALFSYNTIIGSEIRGSLV